MHVDLTSKSQYNDPVSQMSEGSGLRLFLENLVVLDLPDEGTISFKYKKGPVTATEASGGSPARASATLQLLALCDVEEGEYEDEVDKLEDKSIDELFEEASTDTSLVDEVE